MPMVYLSLGTNLGDRFGNLRRGVELLARCVDMRQTSSVYETEPVGVREQPAFLNLVVQGATDVSPRDLLHCVKRVETDAGRAATYRWGPRILDVDILLYDNVEHDEPDLTIPHRELLHRAFVLVPLHELAPDLRLPDGRAVARLIEQLDDPDQAVKRVGPLKSSKQASDSAKSGVT